MAQDNEVKVTIKLNGADKFERDTKSALNSFNQSAGKAAVGAFKAIGAAATTAGIAIGAAFVAVSTNGVKVAANIETIRQGFITLLGSSKKADDAITQIIKDAAATPFEIQGLLQANQMLTQVTKDAPKSEALLLNIGKALAAAGRGSEELNNVIFNLQQIGNTGKITELDIRQFGNAGIDILDLLANSYGTTKAKASDMLKSSKNAFEDLQRAFEKAGTGSGKFAKAFQNQAGTFNQLISNLKDNWNIFTMNFVQKTGIFDLAKEKLSGLTSSIANMSPILIDTALKIKDFFIRLSQTELVQKIINYLDKWSQGVRENWAAMSESVTKSWNDNLKPALEDLGKQLGLNLDSFGDPKEAGKHFAEVLGNIATGAIDLATALTKIATVLTDINTKWNDFSKKNIGGNGTSNIGKLLKGGLGVATGGITSFIPGLSPFANGGIVGGNSNTGDRVLTRTNSGEMILNKQQQSVLFSLLRNQGNNRSFNFNAPISFGGDRSPMQSQDMFTKFLAQI